jgi:thiol-disulfide isomerase/thioredoxin
MSGLQTQHIGELMPRFLLPLLNGGGDRSLEDLLRDRRGALLVFWSGSCAHCVRYDDFFNRFADRHPALGFAAIASRINETHEQMISAARDRGLSFPILRDEGARVARLWFSQQTPRCYLLDPIGRLVYRGAIDNFKLPADPDYLEYLEPAIAQFLNGEPIARADTPSFGCAIETVYYQLPKQL